MTKVRRRASRARWGKATLRGDVLRQQKPFGPALARHVGEALPPGLGWVANAGAAAPDRNVAAPRPAHQALEQAIAARFAEARNSKDFTLADFEGYVA